MLVGRKALEQFLLGGTNAIHTQPQNARNYLHLFKREFSEA
jgi:hypothetical protein